MRSNKLRVLVLGVAAISFLASPLLSSTALAITGKWTFSSGAVPSYKGLYVHIQNNSGVNQTVTVRYRAATAESYCTPNGTIGKTQDVFIGIGQTRKSTFTASDTGTTGCGYNEVVIEILSDTDRITPIARHRDSLYTGPDEQWGSYETAVRPGDWRVTGPNGTIDNAIVSTYNMASSALTQVTAVKATVDGVKADVSALKTRIGNRTLSMCAGGRVGRGDGGLSQLFLDILPETSGSASIYYKTDRGPAAPQPIQLQGNVPMTIDVNKYMASTASGGMAQWPELNVGVVLNGARAVLTCRQFYSGVNQGIVGATTAALVLPTVSN